MKYCVKPNLHPLFLMFACQRRRLYVGQRGGSAIGCNGSNGSVPMMPKSTEDYPWLVQQGLTSILQKSYHKSFTAEHAENAEVSKSDVFSAISAVYFLRV